ncbi:hypothetical protein SBRCBS47491_008925 [Sporothrix bragantina]|uniref:JmjC domain-containing protein n=1 Tax=Sporothrix bragantina TaxID=671064 RepID=A0ABP0CR44_9PEZI
MASLRVILWDHCLTATREIAGDETTTAGLEGCGAPLVDLLRRQATQMLQLKNEDKDEAGQALTQRIIRRLDDLIELAHARFYAYPPSDVPACWRHLYTDASILLFALRWRQRRNSPIALSDDDLDSLVRPLDLALILAGGAGPAGRGRDWIHSAFESLQYILEDEYPDDEGDDEKTILTKKPWRHSNMILRYAGAWPISDFSAGPFFNDSSSSRATFTPPVNHPVPRSGPLGLEAFQAYLDRGVEHRKPLVLSNMLDRWPARQPHKRPWSSPAYLHWRTLRGRRLVPVEVGRSYVDDGWTQAIVPFADVLKELSSGEVAVKGPTYLAQHALFTQMPRLQSDISIPDACYTTTTTEEESDGDGDGDVLMNAWLGPPGTITPLHTDPHHNLLAQVVGHKYVRLYAPEQTAALRPRGCEAGGVDMGNTSTVDVGAMEGWDKNEEGEDEEEVDEVEVAAFRAVPYVDCILEPGDMLYIPQGWWHYVRGLTVSFSVSFWWN